MTTRETRTSLAVTASAHEYDALRAEVLVLEQRQHQLMNLSVGGAGASTVLSIVGGTLNPLSATTLLFAVSGILGLVAVAYLGHLTKIVAIGTYLRQLCTDLRGEIGTVDPAGVAPAWLMRWEGISTRSLLTGSRPVQGRVLVADLMQGFELVAMVAIPIAGLVLGASVYATDDTARTGWTLGLGITDLVIAVLVVIAMVATAWMARPARVR